MEAHVCHRKKGNCDFCILQFFLFSQSLYTQMWLFFKTASLILLIWSVYSEKNSHNSELGRKKSDLQDINPDLCNVKLRAKKYRIACLYLEKFEFIFCNPENKKSELWNKKSQYLSFMSIYIYIYIYIDMVETNSTEIWPKMPWLYSQFYVFQRAIIKPFNIKVCIVKLKQTHSRQKVHQ